MFVSLQQTESPQCETNPEFKRSNSVNVLKFHLLFMLHVKTPSCISEEGRCDQNVMLLQHSYQITEKGSCAC